MRGLTSKKISSLKLQLEAPFPGGGEPSPSPPTHPTVRKMKEGYGSSSSNLLLHTGLTAMAPLVATVLPYEELHEVSKTQ